MKPTTRIVYGLVCLLIVWMDLRTASLADGYLAGPYTPARIFLLLLFVIVHFLMMLGIVSTGSLALVGEKYAGGLSSGE